MTPSDLMNAVSILLAESSPAILALNGKDDRPHMRWMTPVVLPGHPRSLFAVTTPAFARRMGTEFASQVEWMLQNRSLTTVIRLRGSMTVLDDPLLRSEMLERVGRKLTAFWHFNPRDREIRILETQIDSGEMLIPMKGLRERSEFKGG